jgi:hypothetical protein
MADRINREFVRVLGRVPSEQASKDTPPGGLCPD